MDFLTRHVVDVLECSRQIIFGHFIEGEVPEIFSFRVDQRAAIKITSDVAYPDIIALVGENKSRSQLLVVYDPGIC